jgi:hypothetical protein
VAGFEEGLDWVQEGDLGEESRDKVNPEGFDGLDREQELLLHGHVVLNLHPLSLVKVVAEFGKRLWSKGSFGVA